MLSLGATWMTPKVVLYHCARVYFSVFVTVCTGVTRNTYIECSIHVIRMLSIRVDRFFALYHIIIQCLSISTLKPQARTQFQVVIVVYGLQRRTRGKERRRHMVSITIWRTTWMEIQLGLTSHASHSPLLFVEDSPRLMGSNTNKAIDY
jgi:hypothetical protein